MIFRKTLGNDDDEENENDEFEAERQGMGGRRLFGLFHITGVPYYKATRFVFVIYFCFIIGNPRTVRAVAPY